jgi:hypothetical protein
MNTHMHKIDGRTVFDTLLNFLVLMLALICPLTILFAIVSG